MPDLTEGSEVRRGGDEMVYQLTPALLDAMVLAIAEGEDAYGYMIAQRLKSIA